MNGNSLSRSAAAIGGPRSNTLPVHEMKELEMYDDYLPMDGPPPPLPPECQDAGQAPYPFSRPGFPRADDRACWIENWELAVARQPRLIAEVQRARQAGLQWPEDWSPVTRLEYLGGPAVHAFAAVTVAERKRHRTLPGIDSGQPAEDLCYVQTAQMYLYDPILSELWRT